MEKAGKLLIALLTFAALFYAGCQYEPTSVEQNPFTEQNSFSKIIIPFGASVDSAFLFINTATAYGEEVSIHRITNDWDEMIVSWNNFAGSYDPIVENSFTPVAPGWYASDVSSLVNGWIDGTNDNYGLLLKEESPDTLQNFSSRESGQSPYLIVWWTLNGTTGYDSSDAFADAYIFSGDGNTNYGNSMELITGWKDTIEYQSLVRFEIEQAQQGCTRSQGYWKTHSIYGPAPYDTTWAELGEDSTFFLSNKTYYEIMWTPPAGGNAYYMLAHQYIAVALNILTGADPSDIQEAFDDATDLFEQYTPEYIGGLHGNDSLRQEFIGLKNLLGQYNEGYIGPGKCESTISVYPTRTK
jgi:hypothetical protein